MRHFIIFNAAGDILRAGQTPDEAFDRQAGPGEFITEGQCDVERDSVDPTTGTVIPGGRPVVVDMDYRKARFMAYPPVEQQLDALWHAMDQGLLPKIEPMYSHLAAVKAAYPKDNSVEPGSVVIYPLE
jgi:hypothetical protein